jgi:sarcosine oxidase subunit beta
MPWALLKHGMRRQHPVEPHFPSQPDLASTYDVVIIGAGGHGLAAAYYLAKNHGITRIAVLDKGYLGGGNTARNSPLIRAKYRTPGGGAFS